MNEQLDYAEMLEIPVNTVNVVKKKSIFKRNKQQPEPQIDAELKDRVVESVNERVGAYTFSEDLSDPPAPQPEAVATKKRDKTSIILFSEAVAICLIALGIFITNLLMPQSAINTFIGMFAGTEKAKEEPAYNQLKLSSVVSDLSDAEVAVTDSGVIYFTAEGSVYPVYGGSVSNVYANDGVYTVEIAHTSTFKSVVTGLTDIYPAKGEKVASNIPVGYSDGKSEVRVSMYDGETLLNCYTLNNEVPVWNS